MNVFIRCNNIINLSYYTITYVIILQCTDFVKDLRIVWLFKIRLHYIITSSLHHYKNYIIAKRTISLKTAILFAICVIIMQIQISALSRSNVTTFSVNLISRSHHNVVVSFDIFLLTVYIII